MLSAQICILHGVKPLIPTNVLILSNFIGLGRDVLTITLCRVLCGRVGMSAGLKWDVHEKNDHYPNWCLPGTAEQQPQLFFNPVKHSYYIAQPPPLRGLVSGRAFSVPLHAYSYCSFFLVLFQHHLRRVENCVFTWNTICYTVVIKTFMVKVLPCLIILDLCTCIWGQFE